MAGWLPTRCGCVQATAVSDQATGERAAAGVFRCLEVSCEMARRCLAPLAQLPLRSQIGSRAWGCTLDESSARPMRPAVLEHCQNFFSRDAGHILMWPALHDQHVGKIAVANPSDAIFHLHRLSAVDGGAHERLLSRISEPFHEVMQIASIGAMRCPCKSVVAADQHAHTATPQLLIDLGAILDLIGQPQPPQPSRA